MFPGPFLAGCRSLPDGDCGSGAAPRRIRFPVLPCFRRLPMTRLLLLAITAAPSVASAPAAADLRFARLAEPGIIAIMRHAYAPGTGDPGNFVLDDCTTQRNLDRHGREQARRTGAAIRAAGARIGRVLTSQWCRCRDTARLLDLGPVEDLPALNSFFRAPARAEGQTSDLRRVLSGLAPEETVVLVTHYVNILALTGRSVSSGEVLLLKLHRTGAVSVINGIVIRPYD